MKNLLVAEFKKLTTTRSTYLLVAGVVAMAVVSVIDPGHSAAAFERPFHEHTFVLFTALLTRVLILVLGIRAMTDEWRHGTIVPSFLVTPRRSRLLAAKAATLAVFGAALGIVAWGSMAGAAGALAASDGTALRLGTEAWLSLGGMALGGALWGFIGVAVGAVVRSQLLATIGGVVWLMGVEDALRGSLGDLAGYLPGQAGLAMAMGSSSEVLLTGGVTMLVYAVVAWLAASMAIRKDVSH